MTDRELLSEPRRSGWACLRSLLSGLLPLLPALLACSQGGNGEPDGVGGARYDSASPGVPRPPPVAPSGFGGGSSSSSSSSSAVSTVNEPQDPAHADIVRAEQERLYVLSRHGGLSVIDTSAPDELRLLGQDDPFPFAPVELYVRDAIVLELFEEFADFVFDRELGSYVGRPARSIVRVLDARDPSGLTLLDEVALPGTLLDSRLTGNLLYLITEPGFPAADGAGVFSLDVGDPAHVTPVDELSLEDFGAGWRHIATFSAERLYLAVPLSSSSTEAGSSIFVVDISDPTGLLFPGATFEAAGDVSSRWQLDESEGVLRVVSQRYSWDNSLPPRVESLRIDASDRFVPLGAADLSAPAGGLRTVRFDGPRAYALTLRGARVFPPDPDGGSDLISIDLGNPAEPRQLGSLWLPGWLAALEPHGDRLLGLGVDGSGVVGTLSAALFDVSDPATPSLLSRVEFGGPWSTYDTTLEQLPRVFEAVPDAGLLVVPFAAARRSATDRCEPHNTGVQLIDWQNDTLALRGLAPLAGPARGGLLEGGRLWALGDHWLAAFDIDDRDRPRRTAGVPLAQLVDQTLLAGDGQLVRIGRDTQTGVTELDVTTPAGAQIPSHERLEVPAPSAVCPADWRLSAAFATASRTYLVYPEPAGDEPELLPRTSRIVTVDLAAAPPVPLADASVPLAPVPPHRAPVALAASGAPVVAAGSTLAFVEREFDFEVGPGRDVTLSRLAVVDLARPEQPSLVRLELPAGIGATDLLISQQLVATSHYVASPDDPARVLFYLDRVDLSNPREPRSLPPINIPGSLLSFDAGAGRAVVVEYTRLDAGSQSRQACNQKFVFPHLEPQSSDTNQGECNGTLQTLHWIGLDTGAAVILGSLELAPRRALAALAYGDNRLFARISSGGAYQDTDCGSLQCYYNWASEIGDRLPMLLVLGGSQRGAPESGWLELDTGDRAGGPPIAASQQWAALWSGYRGELVVVDATDATQPAVVRSVSTGLRTARDVELGAGQAIAAFGADGTRSIPLSE